MRRLNTRRRQVVHLIAGAAVATAALGNFARAQSYPVRPVRVVVPFAPGTTDILARMIGQWLSDRLGQSFIIENRPGAATMIGTEAVVRAPADGHTLLLVSPPSATNPTLYESKLAYNFLRDIAPIAGAVRVPNVVTVHPDFPARTIPELIAYAQANPGKINHASAGTGTTSHLAPELFKVMTGTEMVHVPYRGNAPALADLLAGQVQLGFDTMPAAIEYIRAGRLRALAVSTAARSQALPDLPTVSEFVPGYESSAYFGFGAPANTPSEIVNKLNREINAGLADPSCSVSSRISAASLLPAHPPISGCSLSEKLKNGPM